MFLIFQTAFVNSNYGKASAIGVILMLVILVFTVFELRLWNDANP